MRRAAIGACALVALLVGPGESADRARSRGSPSPRPDARHAPMVPFGRSAERRLLVVGTLAGRQVQRKVLVIGCIHGTECAGIAIVRRLLACRPHTPLGSDVWAVPDLNPDGHRRRLRVNAHGVDLNRNFPAGWRPSGTRGDPEYPGPRPFSEPETRAARDLIRRLRPAVTIWYHQGEGPLVRAWGASVAAAERYARASGLPFRELPWLAGTAPHWQNRAFPRTSSFVVELPDGRLSAAEAGRLAAAARALARDRSAKPPELPGSAAEGR